jgi:hypothetical protein
MLENFMQMRRQRRAPATNTRPNTRPNTRLAVRLEVSFAIYLPTKVRDILALTL